MSFKVQAFKQGHDKHALFSFMPFIFSSATEERGCTRFVSGKRMNKTCSPIETDYEHKFLPAVYIVVFIIGLGANGWGLKSMLQKRKKIGNNVFLLNLGLANFLFLPVLPFLSAYYFMSSDWIFGDAFCKITRFCFNLNLYGSIGFLTCISVDRYLAIAHPMRVMGRMTVTHSVTISVTVWLLVSAQSLPDMFFPKTSTNSTSTTCYHTTSTEYVEDYLTYSVVWTLTGFCIPLCILLGCYGHVILVLCRTNTIKKVVKQRSLKLLFILILLFSVCYTPYHIFRNLNLYSRGLRKQNMCPEWNNGVFSAHQISRGLVCLNSVLNPLVYLHIVDIPSHITQLLQRSRHMFNHLTALSHGSTPVTQSTQD